MNVEIGTETQIFLFWENLICNFGILSLQCTQKGKAEIIIVVFAPNVHTVHILLYPSKYFLQTIY